MTLSVMSALARSGVDPWREAARLAGLPKTQAIDAVLRVFQGLPGARDDGFDATGRASRLICLLPQPPKVSQGAGRPVGRGPRLPLRVNFSAICLALVLAAIGVTLAARVLTSRDEPPPRPGASRLLGQ